MNPPQNLHFKMCLLVNNLGFLFGDSKTLYFSMALCGQNAKATVPATLPTVPAGIPAVPAVPSDLE